jgi:hypothetical protein
MRSFIRIGLGIEEGDSIWKAVLVMSISVTPKASLEKLVESCLTRVQSGGVTLLDAWPDANETSHGRSLLLGGVLAARSSVSQPFL